MKKIIIVESPSKSKTIESYMGSEYKVVASNGHIRDLSTKGRGNLGIDIPAGFIPRYEVLKEKQAKVQELKKICNNNQVYLATDPDREGEAISWHLAEVLGLDLNTVNRVEFHEITKPAILEAFNHPRHIDIALVQSQETRRMLDRIIGFELSKLLQRKIKTKSAGRVQSTVLKLIVDLENEINAFVPEAYYQIEAMYNDLKLSLINDKKQIAKINNKEEALKIFNNLTDTFICKDLEVKTVKRESRAPLITSTLQQEASIRYGFSSDRTMKAAQSLYEGKQIGDEQVGLITYMRTDSVRLSDVFIKDCEAFIKDNYGPNYVGHPKFKKNKNNVQDAHEAIRPTSLKRTPELMSKYLSGDEKKIYKLIYNRAVESLMAAAKFEATTLIFDNNGYDFKTTGQRMLFEGYLKLAGVSDEERNKLLPNYQIGDNLVTKEISLEELFTKPKPYYTEASIIKAMEDLGIGRPSTYAQTIQRLKTNKYIVIEDKKLHPTEAGMLSITKLDEFFHDMIEPKYTALMESMLDKVSEGSANSVVELQKFYDDFYPLYQKAKNEMESLKAVETGELCPKCGAPLVKRQGRYGEFVACSRFPECDYKPQAPKVADEEIGIKCPNCLKGSIVKKVSNGKTFYACNNFPHCRTTFMYKPVMEFCPKCGSLMLESPHGLICSNKNCGVDEENQDKILCPICKKGHLVERKALKGKNKGKIFWACDQYPRCKTMFTDEPVNELCPVCGSQMVKKGDKISCSNEKCDKFIK